MEIEATLVILSEKPDEIVKSIVGLRAIGDYELVHEKRKLIRDVYFDNIDSSLSDRKISLRLREINGKYWITTKGQGRLNKWGALERSELELDWSKESLESIFRELDDAGVALNQPDWEFDGVSPMDMLLKAGLRIIQHRENCRRVRNVVKEGEFLAEMAIDSVIYHFDEINISHFEVEIEAKKGDDEIFEALIDNLLEMYKPCLRRWKYGKLATGKGIERLLRDVGIGELVGENGCLKPAGYRMLEYFLDSGKEINRE